MLSNGSGQLPFGRVIERESLRVQSKELDGSLDWFPIYLETSTFLNNPNNHTSLNNPRHTDSDEHQRYQKIPSPLFSTTIPSFSLAAKAHYALEADSAADTPSNFQDR